MSFLQYKWWYIWLNSLKCFDGCSASCKRFIYFILKVGQLLAAIMGSQKQQIERKPSPVIETTVTPAGIEKKEKLDTVLLNEVEGISEEGEKSSPEKEDSGHGDVRAKPSSKAEDSLEKEKNDFDQDGENKD